MTAVAEKLSDLSIEHCEPCQKNAKALTRNAAEIWLSALTGWALDEEAQWLSKSFTFKNFVQAMRFSNYVGELAEKEGHHPDIELGWGYVNIRLQTHAICGLHRNDFILASKIDKAPLNT